MPVTNEIKGDIKAARKIRLPWWALLCLGIGAFLTAWLFDHLGRLHLVLPIVNGISILGFAIAVKWNLRGRAWFWGTMAILAALHVPLVLFLPWTTNWVPAIAIAAIDSADLIIMLAIITVVAKFMQLKTKN